MAIDPADIVSDLGTTAKTITEPAPLLLSAPLAADAPPAPLRGGSALEEMHRRWASQGGGGGTSTDPELVGSLIRAVDAVAAKTDEVSEHLHRTQQRLDEVMAILSEDLTQIRAILSTGEPKAKDA